VEIFLQEKSFNVKLVKRKLNSLLNSIGDVKTPCGTLPYKIWECAVFERTLCFGFSPSESGCKNNSEEIKITNT